MAVHLFGDWRRNQGPNLANWLNVLAEDTMCGRFILTSPGKDLAEQFGLITEPETESSLQYCPDTGSCDNKIGPRR